MPWAVTAPSLVGTGAADFSTVHQLGVQAEGMLITTVWSGIVALVAYQTGRHGSGSARERRRRTRRPRHHVPRRNRLQPLNVDPSHAALRSVPNLRKPTVAFGPGGFFYGVSDCSQLVAQVVSLIFHWNADYFGRRFMGWPEASVANTYPRLATQQLTQECCDTRRSNWRKGFREPTRRRHTPTAIACLSEVIHLPDFTSNSAVTPIAPLCMVLLQNPITAARHHTHFEWPQ